VGVMIGFAVSSVVVLSSQLAFLKRSLAKAHLCTTSSDTSDWPDLQSKMTSYGWPTAVWGAFTWLQLSSDRWALETFRSQNDVGIFQVLYQLGYYPPQLFSSLLVSLVMPILFSRAGDGTDSDRVRRSAHFPIALGGALLAVTLLLASLALLFHDRLFRVMTTGAYATSSHLLPWMVIASGLFATAQAGTLVPMLSGNTRALLSPKIVVALLGVILNATGARYYGIFGVVASSIIQSVVFLGWMTWLSILRPRCLQHRVQLT
jgi:O-antigen/teichoic acid export membrane protein